MNPGSKREDRANTPLTTPDETQEMDAEQNGTRYRIDLDWYEREERYFPLLVQSRLCYDCRDRFADMDRRGELPSDLFQLIEDCCEHAADFFSPDLPLLELVFRLFLWNRNQPLRLEEIQLQVQDKAGTGAIGRDTSLPSLRRLLQNDRYYGLRPVEEPEGRQAA